ncbi:Sulfotransferase [Handroanthus impetiginosus]|uniref:Sulfotransferase n=1 Tax=Handroanthus impetiginosus TaxID=429701 RepID=A0A2G9HFL8_9LAMI|nr:Sulfotransferase [Handroanthus impetiginosus]
MSSEISSSPPKYLQEEEALTQECNALISTLPTRKGWWASHLYQYQGFWYLQALISCRKHFQLQNCDIFLVTSPKSGTTWLKALVFTLAYRTKYPITKNHPLINNNPHDLVPFLETRLYVDNQIPDFSSFPHPRIFSTHSPHTSLPETVQKSSNCKIVYLCRNPKDVFVSLWHFTNKLRLNGTNSMEEVFDSFCQGVSGYGPFWDHVLEYWNLSKENPDRVLFFKFEDLKEKPGLLIRRLAEFLGCPFSAGEEESGLVDEILKFCSFENLSALEINKNGKLSSGVENKVFFRQGVVGDWRNYLANEMAEKIDKITEEKFNGSGLII